MSTSLRDLQLFVCVADLGGLSSAARQLDITPAAASVAIKRIEADVGTLLFLRSTRSWRLTDEGQVFLEHCRQALQLLSEGKEAAQAGSGVLRGTLQLSLPSDLGRHALLLWLDEFQTAHPELTLRLLLSDRVADFYRHPVDLAIRYGSLPDSSLIALPIAPNNRRILCASPAYLERHGAPTHPHDLSKHNCLCFLLSDYIHDRWRFFKGEQELSVSVQGNRIADDGEVVRRWALAGKGIVYKSTLDVADDLAAGRLLRICPEFTGEPSPLHLVCTSRRHLNTTVKALHTFLTGRCAEKLRSLA